MKIALIGNQNSGKTSLFNLLTGNNQKVGNWPGVTIDKKVGTILKTDFELIDLPGVYSLSPYTAEEEISRNFILNENPDIIINIVDATIMERSLYLTTQLMELDCKVIVALNMCDLLEKKGIKVDEKALSEKLGVSVVKISALKNTGIDELISLLKENSTDDKKPEIYEENVCFELKNIEKTLNCKHKRFISVKLLENDEKILQTHSINETIIESREKLEKEYNNECEQIIANQRYNFITNEKEKFLVHTKNEKTITDKIDKILLNKWLALPIFILIMAAVYFLSVGVVGTATVDFIDSVFSSISQWFGSVLEKWNASPWAVSLVCDGIISGVGAVLNFVPQLIILFTCISLLETSGYMSRIAFLLDKVFKKFGLSGKSLIPFIVGAGCSVPGIMTTRTIEDENEKAATIMLTPFIPCSAKLPIIALFAGFFFKNSWLVTLSLYIFAIVIILLSAIIIRKLFLVSKPNPFISELPTYKVPSFKYIFRDVFEKTVSFIKRAGTIILLCSVVIWFTLSFSFKLEYGVNVENSILASIGNCLAWFFYPMLGEWSWAATVSAIQGLIAKEQVISSMAVIAGINDPSAGIFTSGIFAFFNPASAYAYMVFNLFSAPCFGAIGAMHKEFKSTKKTLLAVGFQTLLAWVLATLVYLIGSLFLA